MKSFVSYIVRGMSGALFIAQIGFFSPTLILADECATSAFITAAYHELFGFDYDPSDEDSTAWEEILNGGLATHAQMALGVMNTAEYRRRLVDTLYQLYLDREAEPEEQTFYGFLLSTGKTIDYVKAAILGSDEYVADRGGNSNGGFLTALYDDVLGRDIEQREMDKHLRSLSQGTTRNAIIEKLLTEKEARQKLIQDVYNEVLDRDPTENELKTWLKIAAPTRRNSPNPNWKYETLVSSLMGTDEYCVHVSLAVGGARH